jgi:hypothetical protein
LILLTALLAGLLAGWGVAALCRRTWRLPVLRYPALAVVAFLPQLVAIYLPLTLPDAWAAACLVTSQALLLLFCWFNRRVPGIPLLALGLAANLLVIAVNGGFMPITPQAAARLVPEAAAASLLPGERFGWKDILLTREQTRLFFLSDLLLPPQGFPYQVAFSPGDVLIALGAFWLMASGARSAPKGHDA